MQERVRKDGLLARPGMFITLHGFILDGGTTGRYAKGMEKKTAAIFRKIKDVRGLSVEEKWMFAKSLAATPERRWQMLRSFLQSLGLSTRSAQKRRGLLWSE